MAAPAYLPIRVLAGKYALGRALGTGATGTVYEAENLLVGRRVAMKVLPRHLAAREDLRTAFIAEARIAARIGHPNIVDILDIGVDVQSGPFIVMELLDGETLEQILEARGPLPVPYACELMTQVLAAMRAAHEAGIIHRDLKPANVLVTHPRPDRPLVKVLDFGIAEGLVEQDHEALGCAGTPLYMSPEQALGEELDARADVYSACVMLYELLVGQSPFERRTSGEVLRASLYGQYEPIAARRPEVSPELADAIHAGLSAKRDHRPMSAAALSALIAPFADPISASRVRPCNTRSLEPIPLVGPKKESIARLERVTPPPTVAPQSPERVEPSLPPEAWRAPTRVRWVAPALLLVLGFSAGAMLCWGLLPP